MKHIITIVISVLGAIFISFKAYERFSLSDNDSGSMYMLSATCFLVLAVISYLKYKKSEK